MMHETGDVKSALFLKDNNITKAHPFAKVTYADKRCNVANINHILPYWACKNAALFTKSEPQK